jgi:hypothetical protein
MGDEIDLDPAANLSGMRWDDPRIRPQLGGSQVTVHAPASARTLEQVATLQVNVNGVTTAGGARSLVHCNQAVVPVLRLFAPPGRNLDIYYLYAWPRRPLHGDIVWVNPTLALPFPFPQATIFAYGDGNGMTSLDFPVAGLTAGMEVSFAGVMTYENPLYPYQYDITTNLTLEVLP